MNKALSIRQPYSNLICEGIKDIENRTTRTHYLGTVLIHSASMWHKRELTGSLFTPEQQQSVKDKTGDRYPEYLFKRNSGLLVSAIIGEVKIVDCVINHDSIWAEYTAGYMDGDLFIPNQKPIYNWVLEDPVLYDQPILNVKGKLGFWNFEE